MADLPEDFAEYPKTITETRADRDEDASKWTPRDALVSMLREIDSGRMDLEGIFIAFKSKKGQGSYMTATKSFVDCLGIIEAAKVRYINTSE